MHFMNLGLFTNNSGTYLLTVNEIAIQEYLQGLIDGCPPVGLDCRVPSKGIEKIYFMYHTPLIRAFIGEVFPKWLFRLACYCPIHDNSMLMQYGESKHTATRKKQSRVPLDVHY